MSINCRLSRSRSRWPVVPSPSSPVTRHVFVSFVPSITPDTGRSQHPTPVSDMYLVQHLSSQDESGQDPERARMENLNYLLSKVFDGWRMATNKVLITEPSPSPVDTLQCPLVSPSPGHLPIINGVRLVTRLLLLLAAAKKEDKCQCLSSRVSSAVSASLCGNSAAA